MRLWTALKALIVSAVHSGEDVILYAFGFVFLEKAIFPRNSIWGSFSFLGVFPKCCLGVQSSRDMPITQSLVHSPYCEHSFYSTGKHNTNKHTIKNFVSCSVLFKTYLLVGLGLGVVWPNKDTSLCKIPCG